MIKANQTFLNVMQVVIDLITVSLSLLLAFWIRFASPFYHDGLRTMNYVNYFHTLIFILPVYLISFYCVGLYKPFRKIRFYKEFQKIFLADSAGILITVTYLYTTKDINYSRLMLGYFYLATLFFMSAERYIVRTFLRNLRKRGFNLKHVIVVGAGVVGDTFVQKITDERELGYNVIGYIDDYYPQKFKNGIEILGTTHDLDDILQHNYVDEVIICLPNSSFRRINQVIDTCEWQGVKTQVIPDYINLLQGSQAYMDEFDGIPLINTRYIPLDNPFNEKFKRIADIIITLCLMPLLLPVMLVTAIGVKLTSKGPIIYKQQRVGKNRKEFTIYKFRSMKVDQPNNGEDGWSVKDDPRRTKFGAFIRKTSIDELPQFFNVLKGDMSIVGPRPETPHWVNKYGGEIPHYMIKHHVRPGLSGLAQVRGLRGDTDIKKRIDADIDYIENWTPWLDLLIILKTPRAMLHGS